MVMKKRWGSTRMRFRPTLQRGSAPSLPVSFERVDQHWVKGHNMKIRGGREAWIAGHWADNPPSAPPVPYIPAAVRDLEERGALGDLPYGQRTRTSEQVNRQWERSQEKMRRGDMSGMTADEYRNTMNKLWPRDRQFFPPEETQ